MMDRPLSEADLEHFYRYGYVVIRGAFSKDLAEAAVERAFARLGYDRDDPATWAETKVHLPTTRNEPMSSFSPRTWAACCQLLGGEERVVRPYGVGDGFILNLGFRAEEQWAGPTAGMGGWHKDGDFFRHFLDSPEQGLLTLVCWTDMVCGGGATSIARDSVPVVARYLAERPGGVLPDAFPFGEMIGACEDFTEAVGEAGDIFLLHPYLLHAASPNPRRAVRVITNPPAALREPMRFDRDDPADFSPVEWAVLRGLGVERLEYAITGRREPFESEGARRRKRRLEEEKARKGAVES